MDEDGRELGWANDSGTFYFLKQNKMQNYPDYAI